MFNSILILNFILQFSHFLFAPFLSIDLIDTYQMTPFQVGLVLGGGSVFGLFFGLIIGVHSKKWSPTLILCLVLILKIIVLFGLVGLQTKYSYAFFSFLQFALFGVTAPTIRTLVGFCKTANTTIQLYSKLYVSSNLSAFIAPLLSFSLINFRLEMAGILIFLLLISLIVIAKNFQLFDLKEIHPINDKNVSFGAVTFPMIFVLISLMVMSSVYSQMDSNLVLLTKEALGSDLGYKTFSRLYSLNALVAILSQIFLIRFLKNKKIETIFIFSFFLVLLGLFTFSFSRESFHFYLGMIVFTIGEMMEFSSSLAIFERFSLNNIGFGFSILNLRNLGKFFGPVLVGYGVQLFDASNTFFYLSIIQLIITILLFILFSRKNMRV